jgi:hypothetical protein
MPIAEVRPEVGQLVSARAEMIENYVQDDRESLGVTRIHEPPQAIRAAISMMGSEGVNAVVAPPIVA